MIVTCYEYRTACVFEFSQREVSLPVAATDKEWLRTSQMSMNDSNGNEIVNGLPGLIAALTPLL